MSPDTRLGDIHNCVCLKVNQIQCKGDTAHTQNLNYHNHHNKTSTLNATIYFQFEGKGYINIKLLLSITYKYYAHTKIGIILFNHL